MKLNIRLVPIILAMTLMTTATAQVSNWNDTSKSVDERVEWLIQRLTLDEKLSLMVHQNPAIPRLGLPAHSWWNEALHGVARAGQATVYPMPIALAATFDPSLVRILFADISDEGLRKHISARDTGNFGDYTGLTFFTPNINIFRDPRWGRGMETYGEDPFLTAVMGLACVQGLQHADLINPDGTSSLRLPSVSSPLTAAACLKHLAVHSGPEGVRHEFDSRVSLRDLYATYLPAFQYIIGRSDVAQVMCGYNRLNGEPCCTNRQLLLSILRTDWHFDGLLVTDCWALNDTYETDTVIPRHRTHPSAPLAYGDAFGSEVDLECGSGLPALRRAVQYGYVSESVVDRHVRRLLSVRLRVYDGMQLARPNSMRLADGALKAARESVVMLKNNGILPLSEHENMRVEGPNVWDSLMPLGNYNGTPLHTVTLGEALARNAAFSAGDGKTLIYCGGLNPQLEGEELPVEKEGFYRGDRTRIELPSDQVAEIKAFKQQGYRIVLVLCSGSALALENVIDDVDAVLVAWYGGQDMGLAVRQLLTGQHDDFGNLPVTFYRNTQQLPPFDDYDMRGRTYRYMTEKPLFAFGYGLGYTNFSIDDVSFDPQTMRLSASVHAGESRSHSSTSDARVQVYYEPNRAGVPLRQLVGFCRKSIAVGETAQIEIEIDPFWLRHYDEQSQTMVEPADGEELTFYIGFGSDDPQARRITTTYHK